MRTIAGVLVLLLLLGGSALGRVAPAIAAIYAVLSLLSLLLYRHDKLAARSGERRTRERSLHLVDLLGGWPGALIAQDRFRHKTRKASFQLAFWATVVLNCAVLAWLLGAGRFVVAL